MQKNINYINQSTSIKNKERKDIDELNDDGMRLLYKFDFVKFQDLEKQKILMVLKLII